MLFSRYLVYFPSVLLFILVITGIKEYSVWQQIYDGYNGGDISEYLNNIVSHTARLILMHPIISFSIQFGIDENIVFSYIVCIIFFIINHRILIWLIIYSVPDPRKIAYKIGFVLLVFFLLMNGRNTFSFLGNVFLFEVYNMIFGVKKPFFLYIIIISILAGFFCNVSSGTFAVMTINILLSIFILIIKSSNFYLIKLSLILLLFAIGIYLPILIAGFYKNLEFYDNSMLKMLQHGYGEYLFKNLYLIVLVFPFAVLVFILFLVHIINSSFSTLNHLKMVFFVSSFLGGFFGYSSLIGALPVLLFLVTITFGKQNKILV